MTWAELAKKISDMPANQQNNKVAFVEMGNWEPAKIINPILCVAAISPVTTQTLESLDVGQYFLVVDYGADNFGVTV